MKELVESWQRLEAGSCDRDNVAARDMLSASLPPPGKAALQRAIPALESVLTTAAPAELRTMAEALDHLSRLMQSAAKAREWRDAGRLTEARCAERMVARLFHELTRDVGT